MSSYPAPRISADLTADLEEAEPGETITYEDMAGDNATRARWAVSALKAFGAHTGTLNEEPVTTMGDLVANLMHLCDALGVDWCTVYTNAQGHYTAELTGEVW